MTAVVPGFPAPKPRSEVSVKILKGPVHLLESRRIHFPTSLAQALPTTRFPYLIIPTVVVILGLIDNWTKPGCGSRAETEYQEVQ